MKLRFLGTGSAFVNIAENFQSNMLLTSKNGKKLLIDCGSDVRHSLAAAGFNHRDINAVYISHFHADHSGGLEWLGFTTYFDPKASKPTLLTHPSVLPRLWNNVLKGGLQSIGGQSPADLSDFFTVAKNEDERFEWENTHFKLIRTIHVYNGPELLPSYGLFIKTTKSNVFITTDTQFKPEMFKTYYEEANIIFHDCDTSKHIGPVHAHFTQLATLDESIKAKMWLYHYPTKDNFDPKAYGFKGYVTKGMEFEI